MAIVGDPKDHATRDLIATDPGALRPGWLTRRAIALVKLSSLGDVVHALPLAATLRAAAAARA